MERNFDLKRSGKRDINPDRKVGEAIKKYDLETMIGKRADLKAGNDQNGGFSWISLEENGGNYPEKHGYYGPCLLKCIKNGTNKTYFFTAWHHLYGNQITGWWKDCLTGSRFGDDFKGCGEDFQVVAYCEILNSACDDVRNFDEIEKFPRQAIFAESDYCE